MAKKWIARILKGFVVLVCLLLILRILFAGMEITLDEFIPTKATAEFYNTNGELTILTNEVADEISEEGYFSVYGFFYSPETKEVQVTVRYNDSTIDTIPEFDFFMYTVDTSVDPVETSAPIDGAVSTDDSAENVSEEPVRLHGGYPMSEVVSPSSEYTQTDDILFYNYKKLVFKGIEITEGTNVIVSLCANGDKDDEKAVITAHFAEQPLEEYELSGDEKDALSTYGK